MAACLDSLQTTAYPPDRLEIIVVDNNSSDPDMLRFLSAAEMQGRIRLLRDREAFSYSRINNRAAGLASGEVFVFLNNDTEVNQANWLQRMIAYALQPGIGVVGAKLLYPDRTVQHAGIVLGIQGVAGHAHVGLTEDDGGYRNLANATREVSAVTGACIAIRQAIFAELGGFDEALSVAFSDVLLCLDAVARGYRNIIISEPLIIHHKSRTRGFDDTPAKVALFHREAENSRTRHRALFRNDPCYT